MMPFSENVTPASKAHLEAQYSLMSDMSQKLFDTVQKINELNIQVAKTVMEESFNNVQQVLVAKDPYEALSIAASQAQPAAEKVRAYQQHLTNIAARTQVDLAKTAESHVPNTTRTAAAFADEVARKASEETEKATQRQKAAMERRTNPIIKSPDGKGASSAAGARTNA
jgi:phasin family protein